MRYIPLVGAVVSILAFIFGQGVFTKIFQKNELLFTQVTVPSPVGAVKLRMENPPTSPDSCESPRFTLAVTNAVPTRFLIGDTTEDKKSIEGSVAIDKDKVVFTAPRLARSGYIETQLSYKSMQGDQLDADLKVTCGHNVLFMVKRPPHAVGRAPGAPTAYAAYSSLIAVGIGILSALLASYYITRR